VKRLAIFSVLCMGVWLAGCATPSRHISELRLGMTPEEVLDIMGKPFAIRAAKLYENEEWQEVWEYIPPVFSVAGFSDRYDRDYWILFENGKVVQWGQPLDFTGETSVTQSTSQKPSVLEYSPEKEKR
jgi:outer membrane protein assembly factor BamE (lipoprotein component of BamABCDE complex)